MVLIIVRATTHLGLHRFRTSDPSLIRQQLPHRRQPQPLHRLTRSIARHKPHHRQPHLPRHFAIERLRDLDARIRWHGNRKCGHFAWKRGERGGGEGADDGGFVEMAQHAWLRDVEGVGYVGWHGDRWLRL